MPYQLSRRTAGLTALVFAFLLVLPACSPTGQTDQTERLRIGGPQNISMLVMLAQQQNLFAKHRVQVEYQPLQNGKITHDAVAAGQTDLGIVVDANLAFIGLESSPRVSAIASILIKTDDAIVARADRGIATPADLAGRRIAYLPGTSSDVLLRRFQAAHNIDLSRATLVSMPPPAMQAALVNGEIDAISVWQPFRFNAVALLGDRARQFENGGIYPARVYLIARPDTMTARGDAYARFIAALQEAAVYAASHREESITYLAVQLGVDRAALAESWSQYDLTVSFPANTPAHLRAIAAQVAAADPDRRGRPLPDYSAYWSGAPRAAGATR